MFVGEILCLAAFFIMDFVSRPAQGYEAVPSQETSTPAPDDEEEYPEEKTDERPVLAGWAQLWFAIPTLCDLTATTLMNVGLMFISASIYQMLRGSVVLFTGVFSTLFLGIKHPRYRWFALVVVFLGVAIVGMSSLFRSGLGPTSPSSPVGIFLVVLAQAFTATQFVVEEKIMKVYQIPAIKAVGLEGFFGLAMTLVAVPALHYTLGVSRPPGPGNVFDMYESFRELMIPEIMYAGIGICLSISLFNWCGLAVTQRISATSRSTIDTCRTLFIWMSSLALGWETFSWLQVVGFVVLIYGTFIFNDVVLPPWFLRDPQEIQLQEDVVPQGH
ncbi:hypothetical protein HDV03_005233 [Kappamyces sp. JEL0829]|nr:hypothetical protein HDV03_005233 [Kappamyces sp. JEL0829]